MNSSRPEMQRRLFRGDEQRVVMSIGLLCSLLVGWYAVRHCGLPGHCVDVERTVPSPATFRVHLNAATWPELTQMPGVAETLARRIVAHREQHGPFTGLDELAQVRGIGPRLLQGMRPYLAPIEPPRTGPE